MSQRLSRVDLNLLVSLQVLLQERSVTRAANALFITPSAMSKTLTRLREVFNDELFIRSASGLIPTPKAEELSGPLNKLLKEADSIFFPGPFDPVQAHGTIKLAIPEPASAIIVNPLMERLKTLAPKLILQTHNILDDYRQRLEDGRLDFCIYPDPDSTTFNTVLIGGVKLACIMREGHPLAKTGAWDNDAFLKAPKVIYYSPNIGQHWLTNYYQLLREEASGSQVHFETSQLFTAVNMLLSSDYVMVGIVGLKECLLGQGKVVEKSLPDVIPFNADKLDLFLLSHNRIRDLPLQRWVSEQIGIVVGQVMPIHAESLHEE